MENEYNGSADNDQRLFALRTKPRPCCWRRWLLLPSLLVVMFLMNFSAYSQSADFKQGSNLNKTPLGEITWIGSILNANNSKIYEGMSTLQRLILMDIPTTTGNIHTFQIRMQAEKSGHHAYDFMTSWDNAFQEPALINTALYPTSYTDPKLNVCGDLQNAIATICANLHSAGNIAYLPVVTMETNYSLPGDINTVEQVVASYLAAFQGREIKMYGSDPFTGGTALNHVDFVKYEAGYIFYNITWCSTSSNVIIEFAAHIAAGVNPQASLLGYGTGQGAADISGGPYHVSTIGFTTGEGSIGNLDNQLQGSSIFIAPPACNPPTGPNLCPNQLGTYSTTLDVGETIVWSLFPSQSVGNSSGAFFPPGENLTLSSVHVNAGSGLSVGSSFTLIATVTNSGGTTSCTNIFNVKSNTAPIITTTGTNVNLGCNPSESAINTSFGTATAVDNTGTSISVTTSISGVTGTDCNKSQIATFVATDNCGITVSKTVTITWKVDLVKPVIAATGTTLALGCNPDAAAINAALGTATATDICDGALVPSFTDGAVTGDCIKSQTRTWNATDLCGNTATPVTRTVTWKVDLTGPELQEPIADLVFECYEKVIIPEPVFIDGCDGQVERFTKINGVNGDVYNYKYPVGITPICFIATDECGNSTEVCINVTVKTCQAICTYTQGYYGNPGGKSCDGVTQFSTAGLIEHAINSYGGTMVIGKAGHSISITSSALDISKVIEYLPGGAGIGALSAGNISISSSAFKTLYTRTTGKTTKINNKLLAQTITLGLNLGMSINLGNLELMPGMWIATAKSDGGCGSTTTNVDGCNYSYFQIDQAIINAIPGDKTIAGLFELANRALGGMTVGASLTAIASAVDQINNAFDGCSLFMGYYAQKLVCPTTTPAAPKVAQITPAGFEVSTLKVYPNPFQNKVTFEFVSAKDSHAVLEINNILGQKITTLMDKDVKMGAVNQLEYQPINVVPGILIYRLILDGNVQTGRLIYKK